MLLDDPWNCARRLHRDRAEYKCFFIEWDKHYCNFQQKRWHLQMGLSRGRRRAQLPKNKLKVSCSSSFVSGWSRQEWSSDGPGKSANSSSSDVAPGPVFGWWIHPRRNWITMNPKSLRNLEQRSGLIDLFSPHRFDIETRYSAPRCDCTRKCSLHHVFCFTTPLLFSFFYSSLWSFLQISGRLEACIIIVLLRKWFM